VAVATTVASFALEASSCGFASHVGVGNHGGISTLEVLLSLLEKNSCGVALHGNCGDGDGIGHSGNITKKQLWGGSCVVMIAVALVTSSLHGSITNF